MPKDPLPAHKMHDFLTRKQQGQSVRQIAKGLGLGRSTVQDYLSGAKAANILAPDQLPETDEEVQQLLFKDRSNARAMPDLPTMHVELRRKDVTLQLLHVEYLSKHLSGYGYTQFCEHYRRFKRTLKRSMRQTHIAGEKLFVDLAGPKVPVLEIGEASIYVTVLGASNYTFACATPDQTTQSWIEGTCKAFEFIGGVPEIVVPDCPKAVVTQACPYDSVINRSVADMATHYGCSGIPARPGRPQDKAKVEVGVQIVERWILSRLCHRSFMTLAELNDAIGELIVELNTRPFKRLPGTRAELFETLDAPALKPLPSQVYEYARWKDSLTVSTDYHVALHLGERRDHYYSVLHALHIMRTSQIRSPFLELPRNPLQLRGVPCSPIFGAAWRERGLGCAHTGLGASEFSSRLLEYSAMRTLRAREGGVDWRPETEHERLRQPTTASLTTTTKEP
ncbi:MAG: transposase [Rhodothermales bacterium]|jgi:transposase